MTTVLIAIIPVFWIIFLVYWIVQGRRVKPAVEKQSRLSSFAYRVPLMLCGILLSFPYSRFPLGTALTPRTELTAAIGVAVCALGLCVTIWARRTLAGNWSNQITFKEGHELVQSGPYRFVRHPIYTGLLLMCLGTATASGQVHAWLGFLFMCAGFWIKLKQEESLMLRHFPNDYPSYKNRVKALVPFVI
jgi:protein-S-isoprenylcysteine O-methyltransferase Ste14